MRDVAASGSSRPWRSAGSRSPQAADQNEVDRSTILELRRVAKQGALDALARSRPGVRAEGPDPQQGAANAEIARLSEALAEMGVRLMLVAGYGRWG